MKALTICQPYAHLICLPETDPQHKRVENRTWPTNYRGPLAIHAGKGRDYLEPEDLAKWPGMPFGAVVAVAELVACLSRRSIMLHTCPEQFDWCATHPHTEGPWCWVLRNVQPLPKPIPCSGKQGLWDWDEEVQS